MSCFRPLVAWTLPDGGITFKERGQADREVSLPCGQCIGCRVDRRRSWAARILHESSLHLVSAFGTFTYAPEHLPRGGSLCYEHMQDFLRSLRDQERYAAKKAGKEKPFSLRYFVCGEYGEALSRPHYHAILFGFWPPDCKLLSERGGNRLYSSESLESLWGRGFVSIGAVTPEVAEYVAGYTVKKITGPAAEAHYTVVDAHGEIHSLVPEFARMSLKPAIGKRWIERYSDEVLVHDSVRVGNKKLPVPRYYSDHLKKIAPDRMEAVEFNRTQKRLAHSENNTRERLAVREEVALARANLKRRNLESRK